MKAAFLASLFLATVAHAQTTQLLPEPSVQSISGAFCAKYVSAQEVPTRYAHQSVIGWSADGTQLFVQIRGEYPCGVGRSVKYYYFCGTFAWTLTFDASGNLEPIATATFTPASACTANDAGPVYNASNYAVQVVDTPDPWSPTFSWSQAELATP